MRKLIYCFTSLLALVAMMLMGVLAGPRSGMDINEPPFLDCRDAATMTNPEDNAADRESHPVGVNAERATFIAYDDDAEHYFNAVIQVPSGVNAAGDATFHLWWTVATPAATNVVWELNHLPLTDNENYDGNYIDLALGTLAAPTTAVIAYDTQTASISSLTWEADDLVELRLTRVGDGAGGPDSLVGDAWVLAFCIELPVLK
jgi:hypothetical protein